MRFILKAVIFLSCVLVFGAFKHPFYLSVTDLKYSESQKNLQGSVKIFTNDFETTLKKIHGKPVDLINIKDSLFTENMLAEYLSNHLIISVNTKKTKYRVLGFERIEEALWTYIETEKCGIPAKISFTNTILYETLPQQMNIIHTDVKGNRKSSRVINPDSKIDFSF